MALQRIGRYELGKELGRGGMAVVYLARDPQTPQRPLAVKVLPKQFTHDPQFRERFEREARMMLKVRHANIIPVYDYGQEDDQPYLVMHYLPGGTLYDRMTDKPWPLRDVLPIAQRLAEALDSVHQMGIVHRDLKPGNILFDAKGNAYLMDFGIMKLAEETVTLTQSGMIVGTPKYMSPEQAMGQRDVDYRSDLYSLAVIVYELLAGQHPYGADTPVGIMLKHVADPVPTLATGMLKLHPKCNTILMRALAKKPEDRYSSAREFVAALAALAAAMPTEGPPQMEVLPVAMAQGGGLAHKAGKKLSAYACVQCSGMGLELQGDGRAACRFCGAVNALPGVICPQCEFVNPPDGDSYCDSCRTTLVRFCPTCQAQNWGGAEYCVDCGETLDALAYLNERWGQIQAGGQRMSDRAGEVQALQQEEAAAAQRRRTALEEQERRYTEPLRQASQKQATQQSQLLLIGLVLALIIMAVGGAVALVMIMSGR